jgi:predicted secreted protein
MAFSSFGTILKVGDGATPTEAFSNVAEVKDIKGWSASLSTEDTTHQGSTAAEFVAGVLDYGEVSFDVNFDPAGVSHDKLFDDMVAKTKRNFKLVMTDSGAAEYSFSAFITKFELDMKVKGALTASITLKISGAVTLTA